MFKKLLTTILALVLALCLGPSGAMALERPSSTAALPSSYYLANDGLLTSVKLQDPWGSCWAFAITSALESSILKAEAALPSSQATEGEQGEDSEGNEGSAGGPDGAGPKSGLGFGTSSAAASTAPQLTDLKATPDLSERAIAWWGHELQTEGSSGTQAGEGYYLVDPSDWSEQLSSGSFPQVESQLVTGQSLLWEESVPYAYNGYETGQSAVQWFDSGSSDGAYDDARTKDWSVSEEFRVSDEVGWRISQVYELPDPAIVETDINTGYSSYTGYDADATRAIKQALLEVGGVAIAIETDSSIPQEVTAGNFADASPTEHFTYSTWSQYNAASEIRDNHAVCIVGWDDAYSAANFAGTSSGQPIGNGAWLCKNNWGSDELYEQLGASGDATHWGIVDDAAGSTGFFWVSYYDHSLTFPVAFGVEPVLTEKETLYQYDYLGTSEFNAPSIYSNEVRTANLFTTDATELIEEITAWTFEEDETVHLWVYTLPEGVDPTALSADELFGQAQLAAYTSQSFPYAGYHSITLDDPVIVNAGHNFIVAQQIDVAALPGEGGEGNEGDASIPLPAESAQGGSLDPGDVKSASGQTYLGLEAAFTKNLEANPQSTMAAVVANPGESFVSTQNGQWMTIQEYNDWYADVSAQGNTTVDVIFGSALTKALTKDTTLSESGQIVRLVRLEG